MTVDRYGHGLPPGVMERAQAAVRAESRLGRLPRFGDGQHRTVNLLDSLAQLTAVSLDRCALLGELLELQMYGPPIPDGDLQAALYGSASELRQDAEPDEPGTLGDDGEGETRSVAARAIRGLVGVTGTALVTAAGGGVSNAEFVVTGEARRTLVEIEAAERDRAADLISRCVKIGVKLDQVEVLRSYAGTISAALKSLIGELGMPMNDEGVLRSAQRAGLTARRAVGHDDGDPDRDIGPRMSPDERVRVLRAALDKAEREAAQQHGNVIEAGP